MRRIVISLVFLNVAVFVYFLVFAKAETPSSAVVDVSEFDSSSNIATVLLLSERPQVEDLVNDAEAPVAGEALEDIRVSPPESPVVSVSPPAAFEIDRPLCTLVGAFKVLLKAEYFVEKLQSLGLNAEIKNLVVASDPGYWLYLPPEKSRKDALRRLNELQRRGIDSYVIPSGNLANGISLGMFSNREGAESMLSNIRKQGYQPQIVDVPREQKEIWAFLPQGESAKLSDEGWSELLSSEEYLQKRQNLCSDVASY